MSGSFSGDGSNLHSVVTDVDIDSTELGGTGFHQTDDHI